MLRILVVDDEKLSRLKIKAHLKDHYVVEAATYDDAVLKLNNTYDLCFIDLNLDNTGVELLGLELLKLASQKGIYSVVMSSLHDETIIEHAYELGCSDYYSKGNEEASIADTLNRYLLSKNDYLENYIFTEVFPTKSKAQKDIIKKMVPVIATDLPLCLLGESGTGKTFLAKEIHDQSKRSGPFVAVNCAALSEDLLEAELFGHAKGAFTGANAEVKGKLALANGGTLFLDEIGSMSKGLQSKLLKAIEEKSFYQVNSDKLIKSDFRIISATLDNLEDKIKAGDFRFDLFQRLCGLSIKLLPLRERTEDILDLLKKEMSVYGQSGRKLVFTKEAKSFLENYSWPGNIRELKRFFQLVTLEGKGLIGVPDIEKHLQEKAVLPTKAVLTTEQLNLAMQIGLPAFIEKIESEIIGNALTKNNKAIRKTISELQINQAKLYKHIKQPTAQNEIQ